MNKLFAVILALSAPAAFAEVKTLMSCSDYVVKIEPKANKKAQHYAFYGEDVANANVWIEEKGKKIKTDIELHSEGANLSAKNKAGESVRLAENGLGAKSKYSVYVGTLTIPCSEGAVATPAPMPSKTKDILICGAYKVVVEPDGAKVRNHYVAGVDIVNAEVWMEESGKKLKTEIVQKEDGGDFIAKNAKGETVKITDVSQSAYGIMINGKKTGDCEAPYLPVHSGKGEKGLPTPPKTEK